jgi:RNA polymerase sigma-B factor
MEAPTMVQAKTDLAESLTEAPVAIGLTLIDTDTVIEERQLADVDGPALLKLLSALPAKHPSRATVRARTIRTWMPLAYSLASRFHGRGEAPDDLAQTAAIGLIKAVDRFDPQRGVAFSAYAVPTILGEIRRHFRDRTWAVGVPHDMRDRSLRVDRAVDRLAEQLHRQPSVAEIAAALDLGEEDVLEALQAGGAHRALSFDEPRGTDGESLATLADSIGVAERGFDHVEGQATFDALLESVTAREREVLRMRFQHDMRQAEIAAAIGVSQMHVSRIIRLALTRLRDLTEAVV